MSPEDLTQGQEENNTKDFLGHTGYSFICFDGGFVASFFNTQSGLKEILSKD